MGGYYGWRVDENFARSCKAKKKKALHMRNDAKRNGNCSSVIAVTSLQCTHTANQEVQHTNYTGKPEDDL